MKTFFECIPCALKQMIEAGRMAADSDSMREDILREALMILHRVSFDRSPPHIAMHLHKMVREVTGQDDPYYAVKKEYNDRALGQAEYAGALIETSADPFETGVKVAIAGNTIDFGVTDPAVEIELKGLIDDMSVQQLKVNHSGKLARKVSEARTVLYLGDNAGEIVFDRIFIERFMQEKTTYCVKSAPIINDAVMHDAEYTGMSDTVPVIENGILPPVPGTEREHASQEFLSMFESADVVIAKGQGNYETLSDADRELFFLLKAKCPVIARDIGCSVGDMICMQKKQGAM